jgi:hypothetical protein
MRLAAYGVLSTSLASAVVVSAFQQRPNFYSACIYLSQSNACLLILANMGIFMTFVLGVCLQRLFFGSLRTVEEARLRESIFISVTETFLAMSVFREVFQIKFGLFLVALLFAKCFHWVCQDRVDYVLSRSPPTNCHRWSSSLDWTFGSFM